jgi:hypothetical protein
MPLATIPRDERFQEAHVKIFQSITRRLTQATSASLQLGPDIGKPDAAKHSKFGTQLCSRTAWMRLQKVLYVFSDNGRQFFDLEGHHI